MGLFTWREEDPSTRNILEGETTFRVGLHAEISVRVFNRRGGIKEQRYPVERPTAVFVLFVPSANKSS